VTMALANVMPESWRNLVVLVSMLVCAAPTSVAQPKFNIVSWVGSTPDKNRELGVTELRLACSNEPKACLGGVVRHTRQNDVHRVVLALPGTSERILEYAREYAIASRTDESISGLGIDDFVRTIRHWRDKPRHFSSVAHTMERVLSVVDSANQELPFGVTIYEDELDSALLRDRILPDKLRRRIHRVSLYLHYRQNAARYAEYVREVNRLFPRAEIYAGVYAYDRIDYIPCSQGARRKCTSEEELNLFEQAFNEQLGLLVKGHVKGLEFYPGWFGVEDQWYGWNTEKLCARDRRSECVRNTVRMREVVVRRLQELRGLQLGHAFIEARRF
jgi:hypothetical protein